MSMNLYNIQTGVDDSEIKTFKSVAELSTINFGHSNTASPSDLNNCMLYKLEKSIYRSLTNIDSSIGLSDDVLKESWFCLKNKYLYNFGDGTISYLKAVKSMEESLIESDNEEINLAIHCITLMDKFDGLRYYVSLGCGNGEKDSSIIKKSNLFSHYYPIDINSNLIKIAYNEVLKNNFNISIGGYIGDFTNLPIDLFNRNINVQKVFLCLGNTIGNYQENMILESLYKIMGDSDYAIISFEKHRDEGANRYKSSENSDFLLNPFKSIDDYGFVRHRYLKRSLVTGLSNIDPKVHSYLFTLGVPNGSSLSPLHVIWTNRYYLEQVKNYFTNNNKFDFKIVEGQFNIVVLLQKKNIQTQKEKKINKCVVVLKDLLKIRQCEKDAEFVMRYIQSPNVANVDDNIINSIIELDKCTKPVKQQKLKKIVIQIK